MKVADDLIEIESETELFNIKVRYTIIKCITYIETELE